MRKKPQHPCPQDCPKRKVGCRSECEKWIAYEKDHFDWLNERDQIRKASEDVAMYRKEAYTKGVRQKRSKK